MISHKKLAELKFRSLSQQFADKDKSTFMQERWIAEGSACPVCKFLDGLGWVQLGALPDSGRAHSQLGGPNWKVGDSSCRCFKDYKRGTGAISSFQEVEQLWFITYQNLSEHQRSEFKCDCGGHK